MHLSLIHISERHLLVGVGGGARNGIAHVKVNTVMGLCIPVSYTHLDVYKRQDS